jgi:flagellar FliJ protein
MSTPLHTLLQHAESERDQTLHSLLQAETQLQRLQQQTGQLQAYRQDTLQRGAAAHRQWSGMEQLRGHQGFLQRLDQALAQQQAAEQGVQGRCAALRQQLLAREVRVASVRRLMERRQEALNVVHARTEQRRCDEAAQQALWRNRPATVPSQPR